jgi:hypothetical protein
LAFFLKSRAVSTVEFAARAILGLPARFARGAVRVGGAGHVVDKAKHVCGVLFGLCFYNV